MVFLGREISEQRNYSEKVAEEIDEEVRQIIDKAYHTAKTLLTDNRDRLEKLVQILLEEETIEGDPLIAILSGETPATKDEGSSPPPAPSETKSEEPPKPIAPPKPGLAWDAPSTLDAEAP
jgi:cell division protease FtsH